MVKLITRDPMLICGRLTKARRMCMMITEKEKNAIGHAGKGVGGDEKSGGTRDPG